MANEEEFEIEKRKRICLVGAFSDDYSHGYVCWERNREYAKRHGYDVRLQVVNVWSMLQQVLFAKRPSLSWYKIHMLNQVLSEEQHDWVIWIDGDAFVLHLDKTVEAVWEEVNLQDTHQIVIAKDVTPQCKINGGVIMVRNTAYTRELFHTMWETAVAKGQDFMTKRYHEQSALEKTFAARFSGFYRTNPPGRWRERGNRGNDTVLVCDNFHFNCSELPCGWIFHGAGRTKASINGDLSGRLFSKALKEIGYDGDDSEPLMLWRMRPLWMKLQQPNVQLSALVEPMLASPFPFADLSHIRMLSAEELENFVCQVLSQNTGIIHIKLSHTKSGTLDLFRVLGACPHLSTLEVANCELKDVQAFVGNTLQWMEQESTALEWLDLFESLPDVVRMELFAVLTEKGFACSEMVHPVMKSAKNAKLLSNGKLNFVL